MSGPMTPCPVAYDHELDEQCAVCGWASWLPTGHPPKPAHAHNEAYCLMRYRADDGTEDELIWNSRDGVTPFCITLRSGKEATHVDWAADRYLPDYRPPLGSRIFVDLTESRARASARRNAEMYWARDVAARERYASADELAEILFHGYYGQPGTPDLIEVAG